MKLMADLLPSRTWPAPALQREAKAGDGTPQHPPEGPVSTCLGQFLPSQPVPGLQLLSPVTQPQVLRQKQGRQNAFWYFIN